MFDKRLFSLAPGVGRLVAAKCSANGSDCWQRRVRGDGGGHAFAGACVVESAFDPMFSMGDSG